MPWREPSTAPFTRIGIVSNVPSEAGVFGILDGVTCLYIGHSWNLRARLLELANIVSQPNGYTMVWEQCPEPECAARSLALEEELVPDLAEQAVRLPGIQVRPEDLRRIA